MAYRGDYYDDDPTNPVTDQFPNDPAPLKPGDPGYRMSVWPHDYDPGPNWNNGIYAPPSPRYDYNGGSPPDQALTPGYGWEWTGPQDAYWDGSTNQWTRGVWQEAPEAPPVTPLAPTGPTAPPPAGAGPSTGAVPSLPASGISAPGAQLPANIAGLFTQTPTQTPVQRAYQDALLQYMSKAQETPSLTDSTLAPQVEVFRAQQQRNQERNRLSAAERAAATGQSESGYLDNLIQKGVQEQGFNTAAFNANLLGSEMGKRREELQSALQLARATGDTEAARELQTRLAQASAAMQQQGLNLQGQLGGGDLSLRLMQTLMGSDQFYDQLGVNTALNLENLNQSALQNVWKGL